MLWYVVLAVVFVIQEASLAGACIVRFVTSSRAVVIVRYCYYYCCCYCVVEIVVSLLC